MDSLNAKTATVMTAGRSVMVWMTVKMEPMKKIVVSEIVFGSRDKKRKILCKTSVRFQINVAYP